MSRRYNELSITDKNGERVPVKDCRLNPLNLFIPGNAPLLVPKHPAKKKESRPSHSKVKVAMPSAVEDEDASAGYEGDQEGEGGVQETSPLIKKKKSKKTATPKKSKKIEDDSVAAATKTKCLKKRENSDDAGKKRKEEKAQRKLQERIDKQQAYIARLRAKYEARAKAKAKAKAKKEAHSSVADNGGKIDESSTAEATSAPTTTDKETDEDAASSSDVSIDSKRVRQMIKHLKIKAAGTNGAEADAFTPSEDTQLLVRKKAGESWKDIQAAMGRSKKQLQKRFKELQSQGTKAPSDDSDDEKKEDAGVATTTDTENTGGDTTTTGGGAETTTDDDDTDGEKKKSKGAGGGDDGGEGGLLDMDALFGALEVLAEDATAAPASSPQIEEKAKVASPAPQEDKIEQKKEDGDEKEGGGKNKGKNKNKKEKQQKQQQHAKVQSPKEDNNKPAADGENEGIDEDGIKAYLGIYAKHLLSEANAGRATIPEPDENL